MLIYIASVIAREEHQEKEKEDDHHHEHEHEPERISMIDHQEHIEAVCSKGHGIGVEYMIHFGSSRCMDCGQSTAKKREKERGFAETLHFLNQYKKSIKSSNDNDRNSEQELQAMDARLPSDEWPLHNAAMHGDVARIKRVCLRESVSPNSRCSVLYNMTAISFAAWFGHLEAVIALIKLGANPFPAPDTANSTPWREAVHNEHHEISLFLFKYAQFRYGVEVPPKDGGYECFSCYQYDRRYHPQSLDESMKKYVICGQCAVHNVHRIKVWTQRLCVVML